MLAKCSIAVVPLSAELPAGPAVTILLLTAIVHAVGDMLHATSAARLSIDLAAAEGIGEYQGVTLLLEHLAKALAPAAFAYLLLAVAAPGDGSPLPANSTSPGRRCPP